MGLKPTQFIATCVAILLPMLLSSNPLDQKIDRIDATLEDIVARNAMARDSVICGQARPFVDGERFFFNLDVLYWHPKVQGTIYGYTRNNPIGTMPYRGPTHELKFGWSFGLRIGGGYNLPHDGWDLQFNYTHFNEDKISKSYGTTISPFIPTKSVFLFNQSVLIAKSTGKVYLDTIDLELGRETFLSPYLVLKPLIGLKNSWLCFKQKTSFTGGSYLDVNSVYVTDESHFWGIGPKVGSGVQWFMGNGFSLQGSLSFDFQYGIFKSTYDDKMGQVVSNRILLTSQNHSFAPVGEFGLGFGWSSYVNQCRQFIDVSLWYEGQYWMRQNQTLQVLNADVSRIERVSEDISFHGATLKVSVNF